MADVVRVLSHHDPQRVQAAAQLINEQCLAPANRISYGAARAIPTLVDALRAHPGHAGVQELACGALSIICFQNDDNKVTRCSQCINDFSFDGMMTLCVIQIAILEAGGIDLVVAILKANIDHSRVQANGIACLGNLAFHNDAAKVRPVLVWVFTIPVVFNYKVCFFLLRRLPS